MRLSELWRFTNSEAKSGNIIRQIQNKASNTSTLEKDKKPLFKKMAIIVVVFYASWKDDVRYSHNSENV
jgi:hypothetical protein